MYKYYFLFIHPLMNTLVVCTFWWLWIVLEHCCTSIYLCPCFLFFWLCTQAWSSWVIGNSRVNCVFPLVLWSSYKCAIMPMLTRNVCKHLNHLKVSAGKGNWMYLLDFWLFTSCHGFITHLSWMPVVWVPVFSPHFFFF
jgi:hypothetical protein